MKHAVPTNRKIAGRARRPPWIFGRPPVGHPAADQHAGHATEDGQQAEGRLAGALLEVRWRS